MFAAVAVVVFCVLCVGGGARADEAEEVGQEELVRRTQELLDAYVPGDQKPFQMYVADDAVWFDDQTDMDKEALLKTIRPLPTGYSGTIKMENVTARFGAGAVILAFDANETETVFGLVLHAKYRMTDTWLYRNQRWQIVAAEALRYYADPDAGTVKPQVLDDYVGMYELAPGTTLKVTRDGARLYAQRGTQKAYQLLPEVQDVFFRPGVEGRRIFRRDESGRVDKLIDRRDNEDLIWKKVGR
jgi:hypothetical protein